MPRKSWKPQNPFCRRSKLSKNEFGILFLCYFRELTAGWSRNDCVKFMKSNDVDITRQSVGKYFDRIGQTIWDNLIVPIDPKYKNKDVMEEFLLFIYGKIDRVSMRHNIEHKFLEFIDVKVKDSKTPVQRTLMVYLLMLRSKALKGFPKEKFHLEFSRVFFICSVLEARGMRIKSHDSFFENDTRKKIEKMSCAGLIYIFERNPL